MRIARVVRVYPMDVPAAASRRKVGFFDALPYQTLYFRSSEERENYKAAYCTRLSVTQYDSKEAIYEKDEKGNESWVLFNKTASTIGENQTDSQVREDGFGYSCSIVHCVASDSLKEVIANNPSSVIAVHETARRDIPTYNSNYDYNSNQRQTGRYVNQVTRIDYAVSEEISKNTRYLYVSGKGCCFVEPGEVISLNVTPDLVLPSLIEANQRREQELISKKEANILKLQMALEEQEKLQQELQEIQQEQVRLLGRKF